MSHIGHSPWGQNIIHTTDEDQISDNERYLVAATDSRLVMAEQSIHDVVNQARSVGDPSPSDVSELKPNDSTALGDNERTTASTDIHETLSSESDKPKIDDIEPRVDGTGLREDKTGNGNSGRKVFDSQGQNGVVDEEHVSQTNGESEGPAATDDALILQASAEASGGSDTDTSRADIAELSEKELTGRKHHGRSNSVKKPTSFKAVSVTRNFLAKATAGSTPASKGSADKASSTTAASTSTPIQPTPRPRLVAKSGSGLRDAMPKSTNSASKTGRGNGPDPNQVWNKNRPVQPPPPKQFTDEELKQQYGIHLATRLQADGEGKEAKWADIDDDEDDWAPETIEWNDGTKITLAHTENVSGPVQEQSVVSATKEIQVEADQARAPAPKQLSSVGPNATILKVGSSAVAQPKLGGLILKGPSEKPTLVAKPTVPTPVKSPWASLPPVDKVPPVSINPPQQQYSAQRFSQRDPHGFDSMPPPPSPAKEIAADDFNRSWRDHHAGSSRELFNSQSGRYELVNDARRGSIRNEQNFRPPSLLQRPLQNDQQGPAEPSAAFQTSRSSGTQDAGAWSRRRTSSNVSGGSGSYGRRMSFGKGQELPSIPSDNHQQRRGSQPSGTSDRVASPRNITTSVSDQSQQQYPPRGLSPAQTHQHQPWQIRQSPRLNNAHLTGQLSGPERPPQAAATPVDQASLSPSASEAQDPVAMQKRLMRERRELAVKRKQEQQERDEAEKKERIRLKMQALGLPPLDEEKEKASDRTFGERPATDGTGAPAQSPPKPPVPEILGEPKQYGMMKVHHPQSIKRLSSLKEPSVDQASESAASSRQVSPPSADAKPESKNNTESSALNGMQSAPQLVAPKGRLDERPGRPAESSPQERKEQPWKNVPSGSDTYTSWGGSSMTTHSAPGANLWGPPGSDKALGNGTFDRNLVRLPQRQSPHYQQVSPPAPGPIGPIGPPTAAPTILPSQTYGVTSERSHEDIQTVPAFSTPEIRTTRPKDQMKHETRNQDGKLGKELRHPRPIAPPSGPASLSRQQHTTVVGNMVTSGWNNFHVTATREEAERNERDAKERAERLVEEARTGIKREAQMPAINETWRQTSIEDNAGQRKVIGVSKTTNNGQGFGDRQQGPQTGRTPPFDNAMGAPIAISAMPSGAGAGRGSKFFPQMGDTDPTQGRRSVSYSPGYTRPASPPPPDSVDHPAYAGDIRRPMVSLPFIKPKPTVKLPPAMLAPVAPPSLSPMLAPTQPLRVVSQPLVNTASWQDRFNGLFGRKASPEKKHALAVNSATKVPLEVALNQVSAAVSLPRSEDGDHTAKMFDAGEIASKAMEDEEALFEEREFGSLPTVRIPRAAPPAVWQPAKAPSNQRPRSKLFKATQVLSIEPMIWSLHDKENQRPDGFLISVRLPGEAITKARIMTRNHGSSHIPRGQRNPSSNFKPRKGIKSRESSGNFGSSKPAQTQLSIAPIPNTNIRPTFNSGTWARRVSGIVQ